MDKIIKEDIKWTINLLHKRAKENRQDAKSVKDSYLQGLYNGYASAYEISAKWLEEIMEGKE